MEYYLAVALPQQNSHISLASSSWYSSNLEMARKKRHIMSVVLCFRCNQREEDELHALRDCRFSCLVCVAKSS